MHQSNNFLTPVAACAKTQLQAKNGQPRAKTKPRDRHRSAKIQFAAYTCRAVTEFCKRLPGHPKWMAPLPNHAVMVPGPGSGSRRRSSGKPVSARLNSCAHTSCFLGRVFGSLLKARALPWRFFINLSPSFGGAPYLFWRSAFCRGDTRHAGERSAIVDPLAYSLVPWAS
jgi:hypothetical protein